MGEALEMKRRLLPADDPSITTTLDHMALVYFDLNQFPEAMRIQQQVLAHRQRVLPLGHTSIAESMSYLALTLVELERYDEALPLQEQTYMVLKRVLPSVHPDLVTAVESLALIYRRMGKREKADALVKEWQRRVLDHAQAEELVSSNTSRWSQKRSENENMDFW